MKTITAFLTACFVLAGLVGAGCGEPLPENTPPADGSNPHVQGSPQERIKRIESDTTLTPEERARRIAVVKQRNNIK